MQTPLFAEQQAPSPGSGVVVEDRHGFIDWLSPQDVTPPKKLPPIAAQNEDV